MTSRSLLIALSPLAIALASCGAAPSGENTASASSQAPIAEAGTPFTMAEMGTFEEPWAMALVPGTDILVVTERGGSIKGVDVASGRAISVEGAPSVDYGGQGGLGDIAFPPGEAAATPSPRTIYLSWAEAGEGDTRGAVVGRGQMVCEDGQRCIIRDLKVIWRQQPKVSGRGHYSHRLAFSPDGKYLFVASGDRQKMTPAQDLSNNLGSVVRLNLDGTPAAGNPFASRGGVSREVWSYGHRNILGLEFDSAGRLWDLEHGPAGGDELNLVSAGKNYGWPVVSEGDHYDGRDIAPHSSRPDLAAPAISWNPVIAPGGMIFYSGDKFPAWKGKAVIAAMKPAGIVVVDTAGGTAREIARYPTERRIRAIEQDREGNIWVLEDEKGAKLYRLDPARKM